MDIRRPRSSRLQEITLALWEGLFKVSPRKGVTCFTDGFKYMTALKELATKAFHSKERSQGQDEFNAEDAVMMLTKRCNLADTLPGTILINGFIH